MINQVLLIIASVVTYEILKFTDFKNLVSLLVKIYKKLFYLNSYKKEKLYFKNLKLLFITSIKIFATVITILIIFYNLILISNSLLDLLISTLGIIEITFILIIYHLFKTKVYAKL